MPSPPHRRRPLLIAAVLLVGAAALWFALGRQSGSARPSTGEQRARERAAAYFAQDDRASALEALAPLLEGVTPRAEDLVRAAIVHRSQGSLEEAVAALEQALTLEPDSAAVHYGLGQLALFDAQLEKAILHLGRAHELLPDDVPTRLGLAHALEESAPEQALDLYRSIHEEGLDQGGSFYVTALFRLHRLCQQLDRLDEARPLLVEFQRLQERGLSAPSSEQVARGNLGDLRSPAPIGNDAQAPAAAARFGAPEIVLAGFPGFGDGFQAERVTLADFDNNGQLDILADGPTGFGLALQDDDHTYRSSTVGAVRSGSRPTAVVAFDVDNDDDLDLAIARDGRLELWIANLELMDEDEEDGPASLTWEIPNAAFLDLGAPIHGLVAVDYDHDGDLDLVPVGDFGVRLVRNDAAGLAGQFTDASLDCGLPQGEFTWVRPEDYDNDHDVDLLLGGQRKPVLASNARNGQFEDASSVLSGLAATELAPHARDLDGDGQVDLLWYPDPETVEVWHALPSGLFERSHSLSTGKRPSPALVADVDLNGALDLVFAQASGWRVVQSIGLATEVVAELELPANHAGTEFWIGDLDADLELEFMVVMPDRIELHQAEHATGGPLLLSLRGVKDNRRAIGAVVELRAGKTYQRIYWDGGTELLGIGANDTLDWLRITWPNGVVQYDPRLDVGDRRVTNDPLEAFKQVEGLVGSCPFLYTWNGQTFEFISDVLGITPLGLPMAPGQLVPPDHDEYVLVRGDQWVQKDGYLELQFTEELREVTYLDHVRLDVVDHPRGTEVYPEERFTFPPFPRAHTHSVRAPLAPTQVLDDQGRDWTAALAAIDSERAHPFEPAPDQYLGLATPHTLEIAFDPARTADAKRLRLLLTGWFYWTDASVNVAVARDPAWSFVPPLLSVPDGQGGWTEPGPPIGFPAGKSKTMVIDVTDILDPADPRLRLFSTLRLSWDSIRLAIDDDDAQLLVTSLEPESARLWRRGFSAPKDDDDGRRPVRFDWERLTERPRWNPHPGLYTRLGETVPLLEAVDERFIIMGTGEALTVRFDARQLPAPADGFVRDYILYLDGWAKDRDPNTIEALYVEPLPFHGMSAYPYGPDEAFPDTRELREWRRDWNTRPAKPWFEDGPDR
ncbi:MAG: tetratricopeptide (TPR) repeat protein [Chlamydiales bacterium]|jgi:tetratricopeptide (TPR) repeat protein